MTYFSRGFLSAKFGRASLLSTLSSTLVFSSAVLSLTTIPAHAQVASSDDDVIIVTGSMRVGSGGAQDIKHFRGEVESGSVPSPSGMTSEGLLSEYDLYLISDKGCAQILCLNAAVKPAQIIDADYFAGLGFDTNIGEEWQRAPLNLVAVIDRSGSMSRSVKNLKQSLREMTDQLGPEDQISFVLYGSHVVTHLEPIRVTPENRNTVLEKIKTINIEGSTNMDAGLGRGYEIAYETKANFDGTTRVMIFTDERPNVGRTDAEGFMARARRASQDGIGLTTIGFGVDYGGALGAKIASVRGGNLFYVGTPEHVETLFDKEFDLMVSEIANDLTVALTPAPGLEVADVFGVPDHMISENADGATVLTVPSVFMSSNGGGVFVSLKGEAATADAALFQADLSYTEGPILRTSRLAANVSDAAVPNLVKAEALSAQYTAMKGATTAYFDRKYEKAYEIFSPFAKKFTAEMIDGLESEYELVTALNETITIDAGRIEDLENPPKYARLIGEWEVTRAKNMLDVNKWDRFDFSRDSVEHFRKKLGYDEAYTDEYYQVNDKQIYLTESDLTFRYRFNKKGHLWLQHRDQQSAIYLRPYKPEGAQSPS